jgi:hypothetical protein
MSQLSPRIGLCLIVAVRTEKHDANHRIMEILQEAKQLAREYYGLTRKPLGITGEVAEYEAARILGIELAAARQAGYDAIEHFAAGNTRRLHPQAGRIF